MPREEREEKKSKKAKRMKTKEEQRAEKNKKEENQEEQQNKKQKEKNKREEQKEKIQEEVQKEQPKETQQNKQQEKINEKEKNENHEEKNKEEQDKEKTETKDLIKKDNPLNELQLEKIEKEIKTQVVITEKRKNKIQKKIFQNIAIAIGIVLYFIFINLGFINIKPETFFKDLQVFSIISIIFTIVLMEKAYKKDNTEFAIHTVEALVFSICTLLTIYIRNYYPNKFISIINTISILFAIYYVAKCIIIDYKMTKKAKKQIREKRKLLKA